MRYEVKPEAATGDKTETDMDLNVIRSVCGD